jgi:hypothetical protein
MKKIYWTLLILLPIIAACSSPLPTAGPADARPVITPGTPTPRLPFPVEGANSTGPESVHGTQFPPGSAESALAALVTRDLSIRAGVPAEMIRILEFRRVEWPDAGLGCPQPGYAYAQVITPGHLAILSAGGRSFEYHTGEALDFLYCPSATAPEGDIPHPDVKDGGPNETKDDDVIITPAAKRK